MASVSNVSGSTTAASQDTLGVGSQALDKTAFLKLLVAQIKNQNPLNPADGVQFVSQLAQFSELEQMMGVNQGVQDLRTDLHPAASSRQPASQPHAAATA